MDLTQMQYFVLVAENGSTAKAAAEAMVSQSTVSKSILRLERELDLQLFDRQGIHLVLNPAGEEFLQQVRPILTAVRRLPEFVKSRHMPRRKDRINVGAAEATITPEAKPNSAFCTRGPISFFIRNTQAAPRDVPSRGIRLPHRMVRFICCSCTIGLIHSV